tara:strand:+ start:373 stop:552 length:180 start_codon:yes stop_codon:yes gene_type:complete
MSVDKTKCCEKHSEEKEKSGECCQLDDKQQAAEQQTYEQSFIVKDVLVNSQPYSRRQDA